MKKLLIILSLGFIIAACDNPKQTTEDDKDAVKGDTLNPREGEGEGDVGEGVYGQ
ncbi:hypothetical protein [Fulvivirga sediminis]|uniref:Uncharacterized protein n=1 Tax=Fulvivirga sediminis TaxID=2803949 RepID=A0A937F491_9BACT|nr:hypothetical protein [Fulvivirga sediminis]MBL3655445.1 hypothetical protein [Fulvivirga sediminis]